MGNKDVQEASRSCLSPRFATILLMLILALYLGLSLPAVARYGIGWDEQRDFEASCIYAFQDGGWINGALTDPGNVHLPMAVTAVFLAVTGVKSIVLARVVSSLVGALALVGIYSFCARQYDRKRGLLAALLLGVNPYFLSFSRMGYSEGDMFVVCGIVWLLVATAVLAEKRTIKWGLITGIIFGLALSSKVSAVSAAAAILIYLVFITGKRVNLDGEQVSRREIVIGTVMIAAVAAAVLGGWAVAFLSWGGDYIYKSTSGSWWFGFGHCVLVGVCWLVLVLFLYRLRAKQAGGLVLSALVISLGGLTFFVIPWVHTANPYDVVFLVQTSMSSYIGESIRLLPEALFLHVGAVFFKSSVIIGGAVLVSLVAAIVSKNARRKASLLLLLFLFYFLFIMKMPWVALNYMLPLLPVLMILAADRFFALMKRARVPAILLAVAGFGLLAVDMCRCYPDYSLNGYQWVGERYIMGRSSIGGRSIAHVNADGTEQCLQWVIDHAGPGDKVMTFIRAKSIVRWMLPDPGFELIDGLDEDAPDITEADCVVTTITAEIDQGFGTDNPTGEVFKYPYDRSVLEEHFTKVFSISRRYDIEVASVWKKKPEAETPGE